MARKGEFIVKVQISLTTNSPIRQMYIYNENRDVEYEGDATSEILELMNGGPKAFFTAELAPDPNKKGAFRIHILDTASWQDW